MIKKFLSKTLNIKEVMECMKFLEDFNFGNYNIDNFENLKFEFEKNYNYNIKVFPLTQKTEKNNHSFLFLENKFNEDLKDKMKIVKIDSSIINNKIEINSIIFERKYKNDENEHNYDRLRLFFHNDFSDLINLQVKNSFGYHELIIDRDFNVLTTHENNYHKSFEWLNILEKVASQELNKKIMEIIIFNEKLSNEDKDLLNIRYDINVDFFENFEDFYSNQSKLNNLNIKKAF